MSALDLEHLAREKLTDSTFTIDPKDDGTFTVLYNGQSMIIDAGFMFAFVRWCEWYGQSKDKQKGQL